MLKLDKLDRHLLYILDHSGRSSFSELARQVKYGRDIVEYRVKRLEDQGVITGYHAVLDPYRFGLSLYKSYIKLSANKSKLQSLKEKFKKEDFIFWIVECSGNCDLIVSIAAHSPAEFYKLQARLFAPLNDILISWEVYQVVNFKLYRLKYLYHTGTRWWEIGTEPTLKKLDEMDFSLMLKLSTDARATYVELARDLDLSPEKIKSHMSKLENQKFILGYQAAINIEALQLTQFKAQLYLNNFDVEQENELENYCNKQASIIAYIRQIGNCRSEIEIHVSSYEEYLTIIEGLRDIFSSLIKNINTLLMGAEHFNWGVIRKSIL